MGFALDAAEQLGVGAAAVRRSNHFGAACSYSMMALPKGCIGIVTSNASSVAAPFGALEPFLGTNPLSVAVPTLKAPPFVIDMATSEGARKKVRQALSQSVDTAVNRLGRADGYWANPQVRIPLPEELRRVEKTLRRYGLERYTEEFAESLNRAAETAVPVAKPVLLAAIRDMSLNDAVGIVRGSDDAATHYFRVHTDAALRERLKPIVADATAHANVTAAYKRLMKKATFLEKSVEPGRLDLDAYVTNAALGGLYLLMAEEERRIRRNPLARTTDLLKEVFH